MMGAFFALGSICFVIGPLDAYATGVGPEADAITFFVGSILFTMGGLTQCWLAMPERRLAGAGVGAWRAACSQSVGTLFFNFMTFEAIGIAATSARYPMLVWSPNVLGSICFLVSGAFLYLSSPRRGWLPERRHFGWWEPSINGLGCVLFGASAVAGYVISSRGEMVEPVRRQLDHDAWRRLLSRRRDRRPADRPVVQGGEAAAAARARGGGRARGRAERAHGRRRPRSGRAGDRARSGARGQRSGDGAADTPRQQLMTNTGAVRRRKSPVDSPECRSLDSPPGRMRTREGGSTLHP